MKNTQIVTSTIEVS